MEWNLVLRVVDESNICCFNFALSHFSFPRNDTVSYGSTFTLYRRKVVFLLAFDSKARHVRCKLVTLSTFNCVLSVYHGTLNISMSSVEVFTLTSVTKYSVKSFPIVNHRSLKMTWRVTHWMILFNLLIQKETCACVDLLIDPRPWNLRQYFYPVNVTTQLVVPVLCWQF